MNDQVYQYIGLAILGFIVLFVVLKMLSNNKKIVEGMVSGNQSPTDIVSLLKTKNNQLKDEILVGKYRSEYENILLGLDDYANLYTLKELVGGKIGLSSPDDDKTVIDELDEYKKLREMIENSLKYMDTMKG
jgi:hypothetical protein